MKWNRKKENNVTLLFREVGSPGADSGPNLASKIMNNFVKTEKWKKNWSILKGNKLIYHFNLNFGLSVLSEENGKDFSQRK